MDSDRRRSAWEAKYQSEETEIPRPSHVLSGHSFLLPPSGLALDLACGRGGNALYLAHAGLSVVAWDYSEAAIAGLNRKAIADSLPLQAEVRDVVSSPPEKDRFDVIVVGYFLDRALCRVMIDSLKAGGILYYETFTKEAVTDRGPTNPDFRLGENELLGLFSALRILHYEEAGRTGSLDRGVRDLAMLVAQKRAL